MLKQNITRINFVERLQRIIDSYNAQSSSSDDYFEELLNFARDMSQEAKRHVQENLTENELEIFDLLKKEKMTKKETEGVRLAARSLMQRLKETSPKLLVQDWHKDSRSQSLVRSAVEQILDKDLPESYDPILFQKKLDVLFNQMVDYASRGRKWVS